MTLPQHPDFGGIEVPQEIRERFFAALKQEHDAANERVARVVRGQFTQICSYCGAFEAPADGGWEALQQHVAECPAHPLAKARIELEERDVSLRRMGRDILDQNQKMQELIDLVLAAMDDPPRPPKDASNWEERARRAVG